MKEFEKFRTNKNLNRIIEQLTVDLNKNRSDVIRESVINQYNDYLQQTDLELKNNIIKTM